MPSFDAAVLHAAGQRLAIERVHLDTLQPGDVLVRTRASGLCHTDLEVIDGQLAYPLPIVLGHEGAGVVEAVGAAVTRVRPGDHVVASWNPNCGHCFYCERDLPILCEPFTRHQPRGLFPDGATRLRIGSQPLHHFSVVSSHAACFVVPEAGAIRVPEAIPFDRACLIGCGVMTGVGAVSRLARVEAGSTVAVIGCGAVGLNVIQAAVLEQAACVIAVDRDPARLQQALAFGATHALAADEDPLDTVRSLTAGRGADHVFEAAGSEAAIQLGLDATRPGGQLVILGKTQVDRRLALRFGSLMGEKRIVRSSYGGARPRRDFPWLAQLYLDGKLKLDELIASRLRLADINLGFDRMRRGDGVRHVVVFD
jgi:S-(hydroxymethyl)glutathione dehydrogenase / alcohol dehydrogenase